MKPSHSKITKVLVANRGEIALRVKRACEARGVPCVGVASDVDKTSFFAKQFTELVPLGGSTAAESYLEIPKIIEAAKQTGCNAVHPGYGFLSENASFARAVLDAGLIFIGPSPEAIEILGDKTKARARVQEFGVPCVPGSAGGLTDSELKSEAQRITFPVIIKASGGGGGRGMRIARSSEELADLLPRARGEAKKNFGNEDVFIEKYVLNPRHVEVQVMGDMHGTIVHFGTRDCTAQRRHQKLLEEAPAPNLSAELRERIHTAAVNAARSVNYYNAGTAEFLVAGEDFYFLEMNTRIQVEHPVTEEVTGVDLVSLQLEVAGGAPMPFSQEEVTWNGHAIEFRICAEDPRNSFAPCTGAVTFFGWSEKPSFVREETGFAAGDVISPYYDGMLSKIIVTGPTRESAIERGYRALKNLRIEGIFHNVEFHRWLLLQPSFRKVQHTIQYIEESFSGASLDELNEREIVDDRHRARGDAEYVEQYVISGVHPEIPLMVVHRTDGTFLSIPLQKNKEPYASSFWRRSNSLEELLRAEHYEGLMKAHS